jgi:hypothetical protein
MVAIARGAGSASMSAPAEAGSHSSTPATGATSAIAARMSRSD